MQQHLQQALIAKYPKMFLNADFELDVRKGWYKILDLLCATIQYHCDQTGCQQVIVGQIKEKFGGLRFYYVGGSDYIDDIVRFAESVSTVTCEICGEPGEIRKGNWMQALCKTHAAERDAKMNNWEVRG